MRSSSREEVVEVVDALQADMAGDEFALPRLPEYVVKDRGE
jgi:hypothetical protein